MSSIFDQFAQDQRTPTKQKWRDKFFSNEGKTKKNAGSEKSDQDVDEFLRPSSSRSNPKPSLDLPVPRIDVSSASRWPSAVEVSQISLPKSSGPQRKTPRREGLHVAFISAAPDIIGEGGDEAELPAIAVSRSRGPLTNYQSLQSSSPKQAAGYGETFTGDERQTTLPKLSPLKNDESHRPMTLQRRPTGLADSSAGESPGSDLQDPSPTNFDNSISSSNIYGQSQNIPSEPRDTGVNYPETGQQWRHGEVTHQDVDPQAVSRDKHDYPVELTKLLVPPLDLGLSLSNSLTPIPSPTPSMQQLSPSFPKLTGNSLKPDYFQLSPEQTSERSPRASPRPEGESLKPFSGSNNLLTIRSLAKNLGDDALHEFSSSVERFYGIFQLGATATSPLMETSFAQWIRVAAFWFLKGRGKLEATVRVNGRSPTETEHATGRDISKDLAQAYLDLAKAWWVVEKLIPDHPEPKKFGNVGMSSLIAIAASFGEKKLAEQIGVHLAIIANMRALAMSMKRNNRLPTSSFEIRGLDTRIFVKYPVLASGIASLFSNHSRSLIVDGSRDDESFLPFMVGDTKRHFLYSTSFVDLILGTSSDVHDQITFHCALFVLRERAAREFKVVIASQDGQINLVIQSSGKVGLPWEEVQWRIKTHTLILKLSETVDAQVQFSEKDFKTLWGIHDYTRTIQKGLQCGQGEREVFNVELPVFQNLDQESSKLFPTDPVKNCSLRLFEKKRPISEAIRGLKCYDGHRLVVVTPPDMKTLSSINLECGKQKPVLFSFLRDDGSAPALLLKFSKPASISSMVMTFVETEARDLFHSLLNGTSISITESCSQPLPLKTFAVSPIQPTNFGSVRAQNFLNDVHWVQLRVIESNAKGPTHGIPRTFEHPRIWIEAEVGSFVDYMTLGMSIGFLEEQSTNCPGEMQISLDVNMLPEIRLLRHPQTDIIGSFANNRLLENDPDSLNQALGEIASLSTIRSFRFYSLSQLHEFQALITGHCVLYDGLATNFAISRRRMVVPIHKRWEATSTRLQVIKQEKTVQLVAFFKDFNHGSCMNFAMKSTDIFESFSRSGLFYIRIVDAKFALPKDEEETSKDFICLDMPEYPGEHDDINIGFETETDRDRFGDALPATVTSVSRMVSLRR